MSRFGLGWQVPSALAGLALGGLLVFFGCARTPPAATARVSGVVTFEGRPLAGGVVVFVPDADRTAGGKMLTATTDAGADPIAPDQAAGPWVAGFDRIEAALKRPFRCFIGSQQRHHFGAQSGVVAALLLGPAASLSLRLVKRGAGDRQCTTHHFRTWRIGNHRRLVFLGA